MCSFHPGWGWGSSNLNHIYGYKILFIQLFQILKKYIFFYDGQKYFILQNEYNIEASLTAFISMNLEKNFVPSNTGNYWLFYF